MKLMSLIKLLTVSKSFVGGKNEGSPYKMAEQGLLPKFAPVGRPISLAPKRKPAQPPLRDRFDRLEGRKTVSLSGTASPLPALGPRLANANPSPFAGPTPGSIAAAALKPATSVCVNAIPSSANWFRLRKNPFNGPPAEKTCPEAAVQTDLLLDAVKPVRNDLSDADLEVVPARPETREPQKPSRPRLFRSELTGFTWSRLTARLFNSERVRV